MPKALKVSSLETHLGYWLRFVSNHVSHAFGVRVAALDVTVAEWVLLRELYDHKEIAPSELSARIGMTRGAVSKLADRLVAKSLIDRTTSDTDRRYQALSLTGEGRLLVPKLAAEADRNDAEFFGQLGEAERRLIENTMRDIVRRRGLKALPVD